ncbi:homing endonuclease [Erwinia phage vB_EamM-Bue1]|uniref:Putative homing endonuclease n=1 Tax=Erwinia phage vB_EamM-Bue1 TaxID=2099338 RepID=A0A2P1JU50_9CAUD|nr:homing endonuclease [Erwinia phage vB_EamM-Bue1]AVO22872.1 putative homing endonuclease [Erwinia phage vB_EamM-Bue1]
MNYLHVHDKLIMRSQKRELPASVYIERHHIIPKSMGGSNLVENIAVLTAREHFIVHKLLARAFPENKLYKMGFQLIVNRSKHTRSRDYEQWAIHKRNLTVERNTTQSFRNSISEKFKGKPLSADHRARISASNQGKTISEKHIKALQEFHSTPWYNSQAVKHGTSLNWVNAGKFYDWWVSNGSDMFSCKNVKMVKALSLPEMEMTGRSCLMRFQKGWIPYNDPKWLEFCEESK